MDAFTVLTGLDGCLGWLLALVIIGIGVGVVRRVDPTAGLLVLGAGAVKLLVNCCAYWPNVHQQLGGFDPSLAAAYEASMIVALVLRLVSYALLVVAAVRLARTVLAGPGGASGGGAA